MIRPFLVLLFFSTTVFAQTHTQKLDSLFNALYNQKQFHGNVLIAKKGEIVYQKSFGLSNESTKEPLNQYTSFELASVSKQFTAMAIVLLKSKGQLSYDDKITKYLPTLKKYGDVTIKQLLQHTSGIPDYMAVLDSVWTDSTKIATNKDVISILAKLEPEPLFAPGKKWTYSNTGYVLLASIVEKVSGTDFSQFLTKHIFLPLNMKNSFVYNRRQHPRKIKNSALGYIYDSTLKRNMLPDSIPGMSNYVYCLDGIVGDGMVNSSATDLLLWDRALANGKLVKGELLKEIFTPGVLTNGEEVDYGFGWTLDNQPPIGKIASHSGSWPGFITYIERDLDKDITIIMLQNVYKMGIPAKTVRNIIYDIQTPKFIKLEESSIAKYVGGYKASTGPVRNIITENGLLYFQMNEQVKLELKPLSETKFVIIGFTPEVQFDFVINNGKVESYQSVQSGKISGVNQKVL